MVVTMATPNKFQLSLFLQIQDNHMTWHDIRMTFTHFLFYWGWWQDAWSQCCHQITMSLTPSLISYLALPAIQAVRISESQVIIVPLAQPDNCGDIHQCRTIWNIIWSCLATLFACTWLALHLNIPVPDDGWLKIAFRKVGTMILVVLSPE